MATKRGHKPRPFRRDSINMDHHGRAWQDVRADEVGFSDIVMGIGLVQKAEIHGSRVTIHAGNGNVQTYSAGEMLRVFASVAG